MIKIRVATESDAAVLAQFRYELRSSAREMIESEEKFGERCARWIRERLHDRSCWRCWIAEYEQTPVGNIWSQLVEKIPNPAAETECFVYVTNFYVREEYRGQGIGTMLLSEAVNWAKINNAHTAILWPRERSKSLYLRHGFTAADDLMQLAIEHEQ
ncbi:MAG TPA: GNAT family N-acetyltransferase [Pyrinomonadaceae bacterium]|nr:GNAT family N-acetyltransferase [Pyrinomonadaceae bacterium]